MEHTQMRSDIDALFKNNYRPVIKKNIVQRLWVVLLKQRNLWKFQCQIAEKKTFIKKHLLVAASYIYQTKNVNTRQRAVRGNQRAKWK